MSDVRLRYRELAYQLVPFFKSLGRGFKVMYAFGVMFDCMVDMMAIAVRSKFPNQESDQSLQWIGRDRLIQRGPNESAADYAASLRGWLDAHATKGNAYRLLQQLHRFYQPSPLSADLIIPSGKRYALDTAGAVTTSAAAWNLEDPTEWARWWLEIDWPNEIGDDGNWGDPGTWGDGGVWDYDLTADEINAVRTVPREWNNAHCEGEVRLVNGGLELWDHPERTLDPGVQLTGTGAVLRID